MLFQLLRGDTGLLVTDMPKEEVERYLSMYLLTSSFFLFCFGETTVTGLNCIHV